MTTGSLFVHFLTLCCFLYTLATYDNVFLFFFIRLRESFGVPFPLRGGLLVIDRPVLGGMCPKHVCTCFSQTNRNQQPYGRGFGGPPAETPPAGRIPGGAGVPHTIVHTAKRPHGFSYTDNHTTRTLVLIVYHQRPGNLPRLRETSCSKLGQCNLQWGWF